MVLSSEHTDVLLLSPMQPQLPLEILDLIVDYVALDEGRDHTRDLLSLCISSRAFVARCQLYIFRSVTLYPPSRIHDRYLTQNVAAQYRRTLCLARSIATRPYLATHVQELSFQLTSAVQDSDVGFYEVLGALGAMVNVSKFTLGFDGSLPIAPFTSITSRAWKEALLGFMRRPVMRHLILRNLLPFPAEILDNAPWIHTLELYNTDLTPSLTPISRYVRLPFTFDAQFLTCKFPFLPGESSLSCVFQPTT